MEDLEFYIIGSDPFDSDQDTVSFIFIYKILGSIDQWLDSNDIDIVN